MRCHLCHEDAVGQCKNCLKFYCAQHGDVLCASCKAAAQARAPSGSGAAESELAARPSRAPEPEVMHTSPHCHLCSKPPVGACGKCGRFFCSAHEGGTLGFQAAGRILCAQCYEEEKGRRALEARVCVIVLLIIALIAAIAWAISTR